MPPKFIVLQVSSLRSIWDSRVELWSFELTICEWPGNCLSWVEKFGATWRNSRKFFHRVGTEEDRQTDSRRHGHIGGGSGQSSCGCVDRGDRSRGGGRGIGGGCWAELEAGSGHTLPMCGGWQHFVSIRVTQAPECWHQCLQRWGKDTDK